MEDVQAHHASLLSRLYVEMLVTGNFTHKVENFVSPQQSPYTPQEAVTLATLVGEQLQYQVLPPTEIPVPKSLIIPVGMDILTRQTTDSVALISTRQKLQTPNFGDRPGGAQLWASTRLPLWRQCGPRPSKESRFPQAPNR